VDLDHKRLIVADSEPGICRVICFSPRHDLTLATMQPAEIRNVIDVWAAQYEELGSRPDIKHVQIFENRGPMMGASNPHPHCQVWATATVPVEPSKELRAQEEYLQGRSTCLLCEYARMEALAGERVVFENSDFLVVVPFWAVWPFETLVLSKRHAGTLVELGPGERDSMADALRRITARYNSLFSVSFPYSMGFHQSPTDGNPHPEWHLHAHFYPPLLRSATVRKFMVGFEMLGMPQRDITPEAAALRLREGAEPQPGEPAA
jgi:UDPglucose--hexose-1-phosphate uridylyltransferase